MNAGAGVPGAAYVRAALERATEEVRSAGVGERNRVLNRAAFSLAGLIAGGVLDASVAAEALLEAATAVGLSQPEATSTIRSGFRAGAQHPRGVPDGGAIVTKGTRPGVARPMVRPPTDAVNRATERARPPDGEVQALWSASSSVAVTTADPHPLDLAVSWFLARRRWWPPAVAALDLARVTPLPDAYSWPAWWPRRWAARWRLIVLAYEADGTAASIHGRSVLPTLDRDGNKTRWPRTRVPGSARELLFADARGVALLRGSEPGSPEGILLCEGLTDFVAGALAMRECGRDIAVLGGTAGSWPALARIKWPRGCPAFVAVDHDRAGESYVVAIRRALPHVQLRRWRVEASR